MFHSLLVKFEQNPFNHQNIFSILITISDSLKPSSWREIENFVYKHYIAYSVWYWISIWFLLSGNDFWDFIDTAIKHLKFQESFCLKVFIKSIVWKFVSQKCSFTSSVISKVCSITVIYVYKHSCFKITLNTFKNDLVNMFRNKQRHKCFWINSCFL